MGLRLLVLAAFAVQLTPAPPVWGFACEAHPKKLEYCECMMDCDIFAVEKEWMCGDNGITIEGEAYMRDYTNTDACTSKKCSVYCMHWLGCYDASMIDNCKLWKDNTLKERVIPVTTKDADGNDVPTMTTGADGVEVQVTQTLAPEFPCSDIDCDGAASMTLSGAVLAAVIAVLSRQ